MKTIKGPALFLAQFAGDAAPFNSWDDITKWAALTGNSWARTAATNTTGGADSNRLKIDRPVDWQKGDRLIVGQKQRNGKDHLSGHKPEKAPNVQDAQPRTGF